MDGKLGIASQRSSRGRMLFNSIGGAFTQICGSMIGGVRVGAEEPSHASKIPLGSSSTGHQSSLLETTNSKAASFKQEFSLFDEEMLAETVVVVLGEVPAASRKAFKELLARCCHCTYSDSYEEALEKLNRSKARYKLLLCHCFEVVDDVEDLLAFRAAAPEILIIITSYEFSRNDLTPERGAICDSALRLPYSTVSLAMGLCAALENREILRNQGSYHWSPEQTLELPRPDATNNHRASAACGQFAVELNNKKKCSKFPII